MSIPILHYIIEALSGAAQQVRQVRQEPYHFLDWSGIAVRVFQEIFFLDKIQKNILLSKLAQMSPQMV